MGRFFVGSGKMKWKISWDCFCLRQARGVEIALESYGSLSFGGSDNEFYAQGVFKIDLKDFNQDCTVVGRVAACFAGCGCDSWCSDHIPGRKKNEGNKKTKISNFIYFHGDSGLWSPDQFSAAVDQKRLDGQ